MENLRLDITKEFYRNRDADSAYFTVTVTGNGIEISDEAFNIFSSGTFHLGAELEEKLESAGIDTYDIVEALENNSSYIIASVETPAREVEPITLSKEAQVILDEIRKVSNTARAEYRKNQEVLGKYHTEAEFIEFSTNVLELRKKFLSIVEEA